MFEHDFEDNFLESSDETYGEISTDESGNIYDDIDGDGLIDVMAMDTDGDDLLDTLIIDENENGIPESIAFDEDGDGLIDGILVDENEDGSMDYALFDDNHDDVPEVYTLNDAFLSTSEIEDPGYGPVVFPENEPEDPEYGPVVFPEGEPEDPEYGPVVFPEDDPEDEDEDEDEVVDSDDVPADIEIEGDIINAGHQGYYNENGSYFPPTFDINSQSNEIAGSPAESMENWHYQETDATCAVAAQEFVLEQLTGEDYSEDELREIAEENGWYDHGTSPEDVGKILEHEGIEVSREWDADISDIELALSNGEGVIVALDSDEIWSDDATDLQLEDLGSIPGSGADHAVQVIGIDRTDPDNPMVILNDSGHPGGCGEMIPLQQFEDAWEDSGYFVCTTHANK